MAEKEKPGLLLDGRKPADIYIRSYQEGIDWAFDVTVVSPLATSHQRAAQSVVCAAAKAASDGKYRTYRGSFEGRSWKFQPLACEAMGGWDTPMDLVISTFARSIGNRWNARWQSIQRIIKQEISMILIRGTVHMIMRRQVRDTMN